MSVVIFYDLENNIYNRQKSIINYSDKMLAYFSITLEENALSSEYKVDVYGTRSALELLVFRAKELVSFVNRLKYLPSVRVLIRMVSGIER